MRILKIIGLSLLLFIPTFAFSLFFYYEVHIVGQITYALILTVIGTVI